MGHGLLWSILLKSVTPNQNFQTEHPLRSSYLSLSSVIQHHDYERVMIYILVDVNTLNTRQIHTDTHTHQRTHSADVRTLPWSSFHIRSACRCHVTSGGESGWTSS